MKILFVCTGNICRSPSAEGILKKMLADAGLGDQVLVDSAGTKDYHVGEAPDDRAQFICRKRGYDVSAHKARQVELADFTEFDMILAMEWTHITDMQLICPRPLQHKMMLLMRFANDYEEATVPDPFYGSQDSFVKMMDYLEDACAGVVESVQKRISL